MSCVQHIPADWSLISTQNTQPVDTRRPTVWKPTWPNKAWSQTLVSITGPGSAVGRARVGGTEQSNVRDCVWLIILRITAVPPSGTPAGTAELFTAVTSLIFTLLLSSGHFRWRDAYFHRLSLFIGVRYRSDVSLLRAHSDSYVLLLTSRLHLWLMTSSPGHVYLPAACWADGCHL